MMALKTQSAMEYLTTYGWSILVVAVVILVLFKVGVFNNGGSVGSGSCIAVSGFQCIKPTLYSTGILSATIGEIGQSITITGTGCTINSTSPSISSTLSNINLASSQTAVLNFTCPVPSTKIGTIFTGTMWLRYNTGLQTGIVQAVGKIKVPVSTSSAAPFSENAKVPLTVMNLQGSATGANFPQMVFFNPSQSTAYTTNEASDLGNVRFYQGTTALFSWCESGCSAGSSNAVFWVKLPSGIAATSNVPVNMIFEPTTTEYDGVVAGEAPQLSATGYITTSTHIAFVTATNTSASPQIYVKAAGGSSTLWLCGAAEGYGDGRISTSYSQDISDGDQGGGSTIIGNQNSNNCYTYDQGQGPWAGVAIGVANGVVPYTLTTQSSGNECGGTCNEMDMPVSIPTTSFVVIIGTCGLDTASGEDGACNIGFQGLPGSCSQHTVSYDGLETATLATCNSIQGSIDPSLESQSGGSDYIDMSMAAYVFANSTTVLNGYAQYDNGASVFAYYTNFMGTSLPASLTTTGSPGYLVNNGLEDLTVDNSDFIGSSSSFNAVQYISEAYANQSDTTGNERFFSVLGTTSGSSTGIYFEGTSTSQQSLGNYYGPFVGTAFPGTTLGTHTKAVFSLWESGTTAYGMYNYVQETSASAIALSTAYYQLGGTQSITNYYQWLRRRSTPPNNIMPTVSFGSITK